MPDVQLFVILEEDHQGAYSTGGEYFSKPNADSVVEMVFEIVRGF